MMTKKTNVTMMPGLIRVRQFIELASEDGKRVPLAEQRWTTSDVLRDLDRPDHAELVAAAQKAVARHLKEALWGIGPIFGREWLLDLCARIIEEDFNPNGPQTEHGDEEDDFFSRGEIQ
jgi:hypothetical protein